MKKKVIALGSGGTVLLIRFWIKRRFPVSYNKTASSYNGSSCLVWEPNRIRTFAKKNNK